MNAKNFVNLYLTFFFAIKIKKITNEFSIEICKVNKDFNIFMKFELRSIHDSINVHRFPFDFIFVFQESQKFHFFYEKLTLFKINTEFIQHEPNMFRMFFLSIWKMSVYYSKKLSQRNLRLFLTSYKCEFEELLTRWLIQRKKFDIHNVYNDIETRFFIHCFFEFVSNNTSNQNWTLWK